MKAGIVIAPPRTHTSRLLRAAVGNITNHGAPGKSDLVAAKVL